MQFIITLGFLLVAFNNLEAKLKINNVEVNNTNEHYLSYRRHMTVPFVAQNGHTWNNGNNTQGKTPQEIQEIVNNTKTLETDKVQTEIYTKMMSTPNEWFEFDDVEHAKENVKQRLETIKMMGIFNSPNSPFRYAKPHEKIPTSTTADLWELGTTTSYYFRQKAGTAFDAITQLCDGSSVTKGECFGAIVACIWWGTAQAEGENDFNLFYPGIKALDMDRDGVSAYKSVKNTLDKGETYHIPGDWMYLKNYNYTEVRRDAHFIKKGWIQKDSDITYYWAGENALYLGELNYGGLGLDKLKSKDMIEKMRVAYNKEFAKIIDNKGKLNGVVVEEIQVDEAKEVIFWVSESRLRNF